MALGGESVGVNEKESLSLSLFHLALTRSLTCKRTNGQSADRSIAYPASPRTNLNLPPLNSVPQLLIPEEDSKVYRQTPQAKKVFEVCYSLAT